MTIAEIMDMGQDELVRLNTKEARAVLNTLVSAANKRVRRLIKNETDIALEGLRAASTFSSKTGFTVKMFSAKGKDRNEMLSEIYRATRFLSNPLSLVKEAKKERQMRERKLFGESREERAKRIKKAKKAAVSARKKYEKTHKDATEEEKKAVEKEAYNRYRQSKEGDGWPDYNTDEWNPVEKLKAAWEGYRMFIELAGAMSGTLLMFYGSENSQKLIATYVADGMTAEQAANKALEEIQEKYNEYQTGASNFWDNFDEDENAEYYTVDEF